MIKNRFGLSPLLFVFGFAAAAPGRAAQLPPHVLLDQLLLRTEALVEADDLDAAVVSSDT